jgi:hypothetical protein
MKLRNEPNLIEIYYQREHPVSMSVGVSLGPGVQYAEPEVQDPARGRHQVLGA